MLLRFSKSSTPLHPGPVPNHAGLRYRRALRFALLPQDLLSQLYAPKSVFHVRIPFRFDNGKFSILSAWRIRYSDLLGPTKGGVRFSLGTTQENLEALAFRLVVKCAVNSLPHGGAAGGVDVDAKTLSLNEKMRLSHAYVTALGGSLDGAIDILSPDLGTDAQTMRSMAECFCSLRGVRQADAINGKPPDIGGIKGREEATGVGALAVLETVFNTSNQSLSGLTCSIQGFGNAGGNLALLLERRGAKVLAASDSSGGFYNPVGLNVVDLWNEKKKGTCFSRMSERFGKRISSGEVLTVPVDVVFPAATANQIGREVAQQMSCHTIVEIANGPVADDGEDVLESKGIQIIPDVVANAGGLTMSHFEWSRNRGDGPETPEQAHELLVKRLKRAAEEMIVTANEFSVSLTTAAQINALRRLAATYSA